MAFTTRRRLVSEVIEGGLLELRLENVSLPALAPDQVLLRVEAAPLHPSDMGTMLMGGDLSRAERTKGGELPAVRMPLHDLARPMAAARVGKPVEPGNEGAGTIVAAGGAQGAALVGQRAAAFGGAMYGDYRILPAANVSLLPEGVSAREGAAFFVNPVTALAMTEVMRRDGARALVHTAASSALGGMLQRVCAEDNIPLVNIVRRAAQEEALRAGGAAYAISSGEESFFARLTEACAATDATIAFDAVGGGGLAGTIMTAMEAAQNRKAPSFSPYGSPVHKHVYVYGRLDTSSIQVPPSIGMAWGLSGFLVSHFLATAGAAVQQRMTARVLAGLTGIFATAYSAEISLVELLDPDVLRRANEKSTGAKLLLRP